jgi:hypothetical protein
VLTKVFGPKRVEVTEGCRKLHNEKVHNMYSSPGIIRRIKSRRTRWSGHGQLRNAYWILTGKLEVKRPLGRPGHRWVNNNKMDLRNTRCGLGGRAQERDLWRAFMNMVMNMKCWKVLE